MLGFFSHVVQLGKVSHRADGGCRMAIREEARSGKSEAESRCERCIDLVGMNIISWKEVYTEIKILEPGLRIGKTGVSEFAVSE